MYCHTLHSGDQIVTDCLHTFPPPQAKKYFILSTKLMEQQYVLVPGLGCYFLFLWRIIENPGKIEKFPCALEHTFDADTFFFPTFCTQRLLSAQFNASSRDSIKALFPISLKSKIANCSFSLSWLPEELANNKTNKSAS